MQSAWAQVGEIDKVNRQLRWAQVARFVGTAWHERHLKPLRFGELLQTSRSVQSRMLAQAALTVAADVADSHLADAATQSVFRRVTRPLGGLTRFVAVQPADREAHARLVADGDTARDMQRPYRELDGVTGVSARAAGALDAAGLAGLLGVPADQVPDKLLEIGGALEPTTPVADVAPRPLASDSPDTGFTLLEVAGRRLLNRLEQSVRRVARSRSRCAPSRWPPSLGSMDLGESGSPHEGRTALARHVVRASMSARYSRRR